MKKILFILLTLITLPALSQVSGGTIANNGKLFTDSIISISTATFPYTRVDTLDFGGTVIRNKNGTIIGPSASGALVPKVSSATTLNLYTNDTFYVYNGVTTATWTLPLISASGNKQIYVKNRGSETVTIQRAGSNQIYASSPSTFLYLYPGQSGTFYNDGTYWIYDQYVAGVQVLTGTSTVNPDLFTDIYNIDPTSVRSTLTINLSGFSGQTQKFVFGGQIPNRDTVVRTVTWNTSYVYGDYPTTVLSGDVVEVTYLYNPNTFDIIPFVTSTASPGGTGTLDQTLTAGNTSALGFGVFGASSIGTTTQDSKAILTLSSTTRGLLIPRMTTAQRTAISSPTTGLLIYDTTLDTQVMFNGANWEEL